MDLPCDNPQGDELASYIHGGNDKCRRGQVGGNIEQRESASGYHALHEVSDHHSQVEKIPSMMLCVTALSASYCYNDSQRDRSAIWARVLDREQEESGRKAHVDRYQRLGCRLVA